MNNSKVVLYPTGGAGIQTGKSRVNIYGWNNLWIISDEEYIATLEDKNGVVLELSSIKIDNIKKPDKEYYLAQNRKPTIENDAFRYGADKSNSPTVTIRQGTVIPAGASEEERQQVISAIRRLMEK